MLAEIEDNIIARVAAEFGGALRTVDSHPGTWGEQALKQMSMVSPGVLVGFGDANDIGSDNDTIATRGNWHVFIVTAHSSGRTARHRGDGRQIGAYEILERLVPLLHNHAIDEQGTLAFDRIVNRFSFEIDRRGFLVYEVRYQMKMGWSLDNVADLDDWLIYHAEHSIAPGDDEPETIDNVTIPQE